MLTMTLSKKLTPVLCLSTILLLTACGEEPQINKNEYATVPAENTDVVVQQSAENEKLEKTEAPVMDALAINFPSEKPTSSSQPATPMASNAEPTTSWKEVEKASKDIWKKGKETSEDIWALSKKSSKEAWEKSKESSKEIWEESEASSKEIWHEGKESSKKLWVKSKEKSAETWDEIEQSSSQIWQESSEKMEKIFEDFNTDDKSEDAFDKQNEAFAHDEI